MGGFYLTGPNFEFNYVSNSPYRCKCPGHRFEISERLEIELLKSTKISRDKLVKELLLDDSTLDPQWLKNAHLGLEKNEIYNYEIVKFSNQQQEQRKDQQHQQQDLQDIKNSIYGQL
jgi:hypothetical protein